jgi:hypothetical protein
VGIGEDVVVGADGRNFAVTGRAVNRNALAKGVLVANFSASKAAFPFQVLGLQADTCEWKNFIAFAQPRVAVNHHMRVQPAFRTEGYVLANDAIRPDLAFRADLRLGMNDRCRMNHSFTLNSSGARVA